jgi:hypothetical protein
MWKKKKIIYKDSIRWTERNKFVDLHKALDLWWVDYGIVGGNVLGTLVPAKTLKHALIKVQQAKKEFHLIGS